MIKNDWTETIPCLYYQPTGVLFKYKFYKIMSAIRLTHAIMPLIAIISLNQ